MSESREITEEACRICLSDTDCCVDLFEHEHYSILKDLIKTTKLKVCCHHLFITKIQNFYAFKKKINPKTRIKRTLTKRLTMQRHNLFVVVVYIFQWALSNVFFLFVYCPCHRSRTSKGCPGSSVSRACTNSRPGGTLSRRLLDATKYCWNGHL